MGVINTSSQNVITYVSTVGGYTDMRRAELINKLENHYRPIAAANRRALGIPQDRILTPSAWNVSSEMTRVHSHIWAKYNCAPPGSRFFIACLHARAAAVQHEFEMTFWGEIKSAIGFDPIIADKPSAPFADSIENYQFATNAMSNQFRVLFASNGINIPPGLLLRFIIDPYEFIVRVQGADDAALTAKLEALLNEGGNSKQLFDFIMCSGNTHDSQQMTFEQKQKFMLTRRILRLTGMDMGDMTIRHNRFRTPDDRLLTEVLNELLADREDVSPMEAAFINRELDNLAKLWDSIPSLHLQIAWRDGELISMHSQRLDVNG